MKTAYLLAALLLAEPALALDLPGVDGGSFRIPVVSQKAARFQSTLRQQYDFSCGSAALATLLSYHYDFPVSEQQVFEEMYTHGDQAKIRVEGFSLLDMRNYLARHGLTADGFEQPLDNLLKEGFPAIVLIVENGYHHFVVIKGIAGQRVLIGDPASGTRAMSRAAFEAVWPSRLLFVIYGGYAGRHFNARADWSVAPQPWLGQGISRGSLSDITLAKNGVSEF